MVKPQLLCLNSNQDQGMLNSTLASSATPTTTVHLQEAPPCRMRRTEAVGSPSSKGQKNEEQKANKSNEDEETTEEDKERVRGQKRKLDAEECSEEDQGEEDSVKENTKCSKDLGKINKAKNLAISMATKAGAFARELESIKSYMCFMQERCNLLEEENKRLPDGTAKGIRPEEDDLAMLQLEALLAEKSRLANENANLTRENRCLHQLVEYHQLTTQDLSSCYENLDWRCYC